MNLIGARPARFRRLRVLVVGCGDVGQRAARELGAAQGRVRVLALTSSPERVAALRGQGITPLLGNLDQPDSLRRLAGLGQRVLHLAPPPAQDLADWRQDPRTRGLLQALARRAPPAALVYGSTSGVYGDCGGAVVPETRPAHPQTARAQRRVDAERRLRAWGVRSGVQVSILRVPGIYADDRLPLARLKCRNHNRWRCSVALATVSKAVGGSRRWPACTTRMRWPRSRPMSRRRATALAHTCIS